MTHDQKDKIRNEMIGKRLALPANVVHENSVAITRELCRDPLWKEARIVGLYYAIRNEVQTNSLLMQALEEEKTVVLPRVEKGLVFCEISDPDELEKRAWGLFEPKEKCPSLDDIGKIDLLIVPVVAFDRQGFRLGYGKGFYDRILGCCRPKSLGLAYDFQKVDALPHEAWDRQMGAVLTEKRRYLFDS